MTPARRLTTHLILQTLPMCSGLTGCCYFEGRHLKSAPFHILETPAVSGPTGGWRCAPDAQGSCTRSLEFAKPAELDILKLQGISSS
jgi:hypothetical protein